MSIDFKDAVESKIIAKLGQFKRQGGELIFKVCPYCGSVKSKFQVNVDKKVFNCWVCSKSGSISKLCWEQKIDIKSDTLMANSVDKLQQELKKQQELYQRTAKAKVLELPNDCYLRMRDYQQKDFDFKSAEYYSYYYLYSRGFTDKDIAQYDVWYWNYRVLFPFYDVCGKLIFWTARAIDKAKPKYLHAATDRHNLIIKYFGATKEVYIVEGIFDAISLHKQGKTVIMALGSNITEFQLEYLRLSELKIVLCLDADMTSKQHKLQETLKSILGSDKVDAFFLTHGDVAEKGYSKESGELNLKGYCLAKLTSGASYDVLRLRKSR